MRHLAPVLVALFAATGCGDRPARVKGRLVENGRPAALAADEQAAVTFHLLGADGKPTDRYYAAVVRPDGTFELLGSGGELPVGSYRLTFDASAPAASGGVGKYAKKFGLAEGDYRVELKPGSNDLAIDLARPPG